MTDQLEIIGPGGAIRFHDLNPVKGFTNIGSHPDNDIVIESPDVAPFHAVIDHRQRPAHIINMGRGGHITVAGQRVEPNASHSIANWDTIELDGHTLVMMQDMAGGGTTVMAPIPEYAPVTNYAPTPVSAPPPVSSWDTVPTPPPSTPPSDTFIAPLPIPSPADPATIAPAAMPGVNAPIPDQVDEQILIELSQREFVLDVEQSATFDITIINGGPIVATFEIRIDGLDPFWVVAPASVNLYEGERATRTVTLSVQRKPYNRAGNHYFGVHVTSPELPGHRAVAGCILTLNPYYEHSVTELSPRTQRLNWFKRAGLVSYTVGNLGNSPAAFRLDASDDERAMQFEFKLEPQGANLAKQAELKLQPEQIRTVQVNFSTQKRIFFGFTSQLQSFTITTTPLQGAPMPRSLLGQAETSPLIGPIHVFLLLATIVILIALIFRPNINTYTVDPDTIISGEEVKFTWDVSPFADVTVDQGLGEQGRGDGTLTILPVEDLTYRLTASTPLLSNLLPFWFTRTEERTVIVDPLYPIVRFRSNVDSVLTGESITLNWEVLNAEEVVFINNGALETLPKEQYRSSRIVSPEGEGTYTIQARNRYTTSQPVSRTIIVNSIDPTPTPFPQPIIQRFDALPGSVTAGESVTLEWVTTSAEKVRLDPGGQEFTTTGRVTLKPDVTTTYILTAINGPNEVRSLREVVVVPPPTATPVPGTPVIEFFTGTPLEVALGSNEAENVQLAWSVTGDVTDVEVTGDTIGKISGLAQQGNLTVAAGEEDTQFTITAYNGDLTASQTVVVKVVVPIPVISSITPASTTQVGGSSLSLIISGSNFVNGAVVRWEDSDRSTTFISSTQLSTTLTTADLAEAGTGKISVFNPATAGGGSSSPVTFFVNNPAPTIGTITPSEDIVRTTDLTLIVTGTNFVPVSTVRWNGTEMETTYNSSTQLTAVIPTDKVSVAGTATVNVFTPTPGGGSSGTITFTIKNPLPTITLVTPSSVLVGSDTVTVTIAGTGFVSGTNGTKISWDGDIRNATYVSSTQLSIVIPAEDLVFPGTVNVNVVNLAPGGGSSPTGKQFIIKRAPVSVTVGSSPPSPVTGQPTTFSAVITPTSGITSQSPSGLATFTAVDSFNNTVILGQAAVSFSSGNPSTATLTNNAFPAASSPVSITVTYGGDSYFEERTSAPLSLTVGEANVKVDVSSSPSPSALNQNFTLTASITASPPGAMIPISGEPAGGTVQFLRNGTPVGDPVSIANGAANLIVCGYGQSLGSGGCVVPAGVMQGGNNTITAIYNGDDDPNYNTGSSAIPHLHSISKVTPSVTVTSNNPTYGQQSTLTATVNSSVSGITPQNGGIVTFKEGTTVLGTAVLSGAAGCCATATLNVSAFVFGAGPHSITADFNGSNDPNLNNMTSGAHSHSVSEASTTTAVTSTSPNPSTYLSNSFFQASVSGGAAGTPATGTITFKSNVYGNICTGTLSGGVASCSSSSVVAGSHNITAVYNGEDANFAASGDSPTYGHTINKYTLSSSNIAITSCTSPTFHGQTYTYQARVNIPGGVAPVGLIYFKYETHWSSGIPYADLAYTYSQESSSNMDANGYANNFSFTWYTKDQFSKVTATFNGDSNYTGTISTFCFVAGP